MLRIVLGFLFVTAVVAALTPSAGGQAPPREPVINRWELSGCPARTPTEANRLVISEHDDREEAE